MPESAAQSSEGCIVTYPEGAKVLTRTIRTKIKASETHSYNGTPCWEWTGSCDSSGYAQVKMHGRLVLVHREVHEKMIGPIHLRCSECNGQGVTEPDRHDHPDHGLCPRCGGSGMESDTTVDHLCKGLRNCVQPAHFELVSRSENSTRANRRRWDEGYSRKINNQGETS
jgi:hypothetical protein